MIDKPNTEDALKKIKDLEIPDNEMDDLSTKIINNPDFSHIQRALLHFSLGLKACLDMEKNTEIASLGSFTIEADPFNLLGIQNRIEQSRKNLTIFVDEDRLVGNYDERGLDACKCGCGQKFISKKMFKDFLEKNYSDIEADVSITSMDTTEDDQKVVKVLVCLIQKVPKE